MLNIQQQTLLCEMLVCYANNHGNKITTKEIINQAFKNNVNIGNNENFFSNMKLLEELGYVKRFKYKPQRVYYQLTANGWAFANIIGLQKNNSSRYRQIAKEIAWIP
jgi:Fe2+ or Zn2+ uptake regulation protein